MSEMVERVARAIVARRNLPEGSEINWDAFIADARAAITAMSEPTKKMCMNGANDMVSEINVRNIWRDMVEESLK